MLRFVCELQVWIHGGAFIRMFTYPGYPETNNATTLAYFGDVVVVTIHYRLAIFGSLHTGDKRLKGGEVTKRFDKQLIKGLRNCP